MQFPVLILYDITMREEDKKLQKRFIDLANQAYYNDTFCFTNFLSMADIDILMSSVDGKQYELFGGMEGCERMVARFGNKEELGYEVPYPVAILKIEPFIMKFADNFTHRDFLGALMNLGIEREILGDILLDGKVAYLFVMENMAEFIVQNLDKVKHTNVRVSRMEQIPAELSVHTQEKDIIVASKRLDVVIAKAYNMSRSKVLELFAQRKVFVNGRCQENNSALLKADDIVAVRGFGKFIFRHENYETKKGRLCLKIEEYV